MIIPKEAALEKNSKRFDEMQILLGDEISDPIAIMCTHGVKTIIRPYKGPSHECT